MGAELKPAGLTTTMGAALKLAFNLFKLLTGALLDAAILG